MFWEFVEAVTGVDRTHIKNTIKARAIQYVEAIVCKCGHPKWEHLQEGGIGGNCNKCACPMFEPRNKV